LASFCGPTTDHVCISNFKLVIGSRKDEYNMILESFKDNKIGGFARIIVVNPMHDKLPHLVLVATCTCNCFDSAWMRQQWGIIDTL